MKMPPANPILALATLRCLVGFLGEKKQNAWWDCGFLDSTGVRFLETIFPRTAKSAAARSTGEAASLVHDAAIGRLGTFHLFRLPTAIEDQIAREIEVFNQSAPFPFTSAQVALEQIAAQMDVSLRASPGPVQIGVEKRVTTTHSLTELAAHYYSAFTGGFRCFPYFAADHVAH